MEVVWRHATDLLFFCGHAFEVEVQAFVLMSNHYHLLVRSPAERLPPTMRYFNGELSRTLGREMKRINHIWGGPYFASLVNHWQYEHAVYKYVYRNPVDAGICANVEDYQYSTLRGLFGQARCPVTVIDPLDITTDPESIFRWLNDSFHGNQREQIRRGLRYAEFDLRAGDDKANPWTDDLLYRENA